MPPKTLRQQHACYPGPPPGTATRDRYPASFLRAMTDKTSRAAATSPTGDA